MDPAEGRALRRSSEVPQGGISIDQDGEPYELARFVMRGDMTGLLYDAPVE